MGPCGESNRGDPDAECCHGLTCTKLNDWLHVCQPPREEISALHHGQCAKSDELCGFSDEPEKTCCDQDLKCQWIGKSLAKACQKPRDWVSKKGASKKDQCMEEDEICGYSDQLEKECCDEELKCQFIGRSLLKRCQLPRDWTSKKTQKSPSKKDQCAKKYEVCGVLDEPEKECCDKELKCQYIGRSLRKACQPPRDWAKDQCAREDELCGFADEPEKTCCNGELKCQYLGRSLLKKCQLPKDWVFKVQRQDL